MATEEEEVRITLRLPAGLRDRLKAAADRGFGSMNGEIVRRLSESLEDGRIFRIPPFLGERIAAAASKGGRSLRHEIHATLLEKYPVPDADLETVSQNVKEMIAEAGITKAQLGPVLSRIRAAVQEYEDEYNRQISEEHFE